MALRAGTIRVVRDGQVLVQPFLDLTGQVSTGHSDQGLLGLAFHPQYASNGLFFVTYTDLVGDSVISRFAVDPSDPDRGDPTSEEILLVIPQPHGAHNVGQLAFGPDGYLYIGAGDGGPAGCPTCGDPNNYGQDLSVLLGKILRLDVDAPLPYAVPPTNPFVGVSGAAPEIWSYGLRNPWKFSFDRSTGDLFISDVGQTQWEEVSFEPAGSPGGVNYGWRRMEGAHCYPTEPCDTAGLTLPVFEFGHTDGRCAVIGGYVVRGIESPALAGRYLAADFCTGDLWSLLPATGGGFDDELLARTERLATFGEDEAGEVLIATFATGQLLRIAGRVTDGPACDSDGQGILDAADLARTVRALAEPGYLPPGRTECDGIAGLDAADLVALVGGIMAG